MRRESLKPRQVTRVVPYKAVDKSLGSNSQSNRSLACIFNIFATTLSESSAHTHRKPQDLLSTETTTLQSHNVYRHQNLLRLPLHCYRKSRVSIQQSQDSSDRALHGL